MSEVDPSVSQQSVIDLVVSQTSRVLETYRVDHRLIEEHANGERRITQGGYGDRQVFELVQNGADELLADPGGEIRIVLTATHLYCANQGAPITPQGVDTILRMGVSRKRGGQIGRFGVGVKSVLSVSDAPQFFSRTGCFGFDREWSAEQIRTVHPDATETPVLRMGRPLDPDRHLASDPVLAELFSWATTVVRLPLKPASVQRLGEDLRTFPTEFPLFSSHVGTVTLEDRRVLPPRRRVISQMVDGDRHTIQEERADGSDVTSKWRVFTRTFRPGKAALEAAGELHDRPEVDVSWAVPDRDGRIRELGTFWAFFPTNYATLLRGILNAPWKTSEDRQNLYKGNAFNDELINEAARLIVQSLPELAPADDPAAYIDLLPGRGREAPQWADRQLTLAIWAIAGQEPSLPDQDGRLRRPSELSLHPEKLQEEWLRLWASHSGRPRDWCHHSVEGRDRRARSERVMEAAGRNVASVRQWLEALVQDESPAASALAIRIIAGMVRAEHTLAEEAVKARVVLTESTGFVAPVRGKVFRRSSADTLADQLVYVDDRVLAEFDVLPALDVLGIHEAHAAGRFAAVVEQGFHGYSDAQWTAFWELARQTGPSETVAILRDQVKDPSTELKVRVMSGEFRRIAFSLLPGPVVPADGSRDQRIAVDLRFHEDDRPVLRDLGLRDRPVTSVAPQEEPWFESYVESRWKLYCKRLPASSSRPALKSIRTDGADPAGPLHFLTELSPEGRAAYLANLPPTGLVTSWTLQIGANQSTRHHVVSPLVWMAHAHGRLHTSRGLRAVPQCVGPGLGKHRDLLPVADLPTNIAEALKLPGSLGEIRPRVWTDLLKEAAASEDDTFPGKVYAMVLEAEADWPSDIPTRCRVGDAWSSEHSDAEIAVTAVRSEYDELIRELIPALLMPREEDAEEMIERWGMLSPADIIKKDIRFVSDTEPVLLVDEFPHLRISHRNQVDGWSLARCTELEEIVRTPGGTRMEPMPAAVQNHVVLVLRPDDDLAALTAVDRLLKLGLGPHGCKGILDRREQQRNNERIRMARHAEDEAAKMLALIGEDKLRQGLPQGLLESEESEAGQAPDAHRVAQLALDAHGSSILRHHSKDIAANIPELAGQFRGDSRSLQIVNQLDLPESFAGARGRSLDPMLTVEGPRAFPRLHDYQERLAANLFDLLTRYKAPKAMLCLPTGAGKTRVASESIIRVIKERGLRGHPVLWIAQTEELCEQAVQSWKFVWSKVGPEESLTISRLWSTNEAAAVESGAHLVVATDAKLESCLGRDDYTWLQDAALVVVDEAHVAITPRYTEILKLLGISLVQRQAERPLIGLTATPYRGNEEETRRLVSRFGGVRLDEDVFPNGDPYAELQELGVLARVEHRELAGASISLTDAELQTIDFRGRLPAAAEQRLGDDNDRNRMLIEEICKVVEDGPVLLFAASVNHAKLMAARLNGNGIRASAIDAGTPAPERRKVVEDFRSGRIRVITNYGVLAQGFDAPATRTVIVARPTYSPNAYQQMIGRGLRGPRNGGKETCLILDVADNITNYHKKLAFTEFEYLWSRS